MTNINAITAIIRIEGIKRAARMSPYNLSSHSRYLRNSAQIAGVVPLRSATRIREIDTKGKLSGNCAIESAKVLPDCTCADKFRIIPLNLRFGISSPTKSNAFRSVTPDCNRTESWKNRSANSRRDTFSRPVTSCTISPLTPRDFVSTSISSKLSRSSPDKRASILVALVEPRISRPSVLIAR